jgi:hypothetical protein
LSREFRCTMARTRRVICSFRPARHLGGEKTAPPRRIIVEIKSHRKFCVLLSLRREKNEPTSRMQTTHPKEDSQNLSLYVEAAMR